MNCEKAKEILYDYIDGCLDDDLRQEIEEHISGCTECRREYELISAIINNCHNFDEEDLPHDFEHNLHERLMSEKHDAGRKRFGIRFNRINTVAAAALVVAISMGVIFGSGILNSRKESSTAELSSTADSASLKIAAQAPSPENKAVQFNIAADTTINGSTSAPQDQSVGQDYGAGSTPAAGSTDRGMTYITVTIKINQEQYGSYYESIVSSIEGFSGYLEQKNPETYVLPMTNWDSLYKKLSEEYSINDISVSSDDISKQYISLKDEIVTLEEKAKESSKDGENNNINKQLDEKKAELNELDKKVGYVFIEINRI